MWLPPAVASSCQQDPLCQREAPKGAQCDLVRPKEPLPSNRSHAGRDLWKGPPDLCPLGHVRASSQETESLVPLHRPSLRAASGNPAMCISLPVGEKADFLGPGQVSSFQEGENMAGIAPTGEGLTVDTGQRLAASRVGGCVLHIRAPAPLSGLRSGVCPGPHSVLPPTTWRAQCPGQAPE